MSTIFLSISPTHFSHILDGYKEYEYRTLFPRKPIDKTRIYETSPIKKIVAEVEALSIISMPPTILWEQTKDYSGISKEEKGNSL